jgi:glutamate N-acetyltransferase/amino-acid N-acetyltransferase
MNIWIGDVQVVQGGVGVEGAEKKAHGVMRQREYTITLDLGLGSGTNWIWTCDLTYDYIRINAEYKT